MVDGDAALRILGQRSVFVIGRPVVDEQRVNAVRIDAVDKEPLRAELLQVDVSERTIFRDLVGFASRRGQQRKGRSQRPPRLSYAAPTGRSFAGSTGTLSSCTAGRLNLAKRVKLVSCAATQTRPGDGTARRLKTMEKRWSRLT